MLEGGGQASECPCIPVLDPPSGIGMARYLSCSLSPSRIHAFTFSCSLSLLLFSPLSRLLCLLACLSCLARSCFECLLKLVWRRLKLFFVFSLVVCRFPWHSKPFFDPRGRALQASGPKGASPPSIHASAVACTSPPELTSPPPPPRLLLLSQQ